MLTRYVLSVLAMRRFQFSIAALILFTTSAAIIVRFWPRKVDPSIAHRRISSILLSEKSNPEKVRALSQFVRIGESADQISERLGGCHDIYGHGPGFFQYTYDESRLVISFYPDGISYGIGYYPPPSDDGVSHLTWLEVPESASWPR